MLYSYVESSYKAGFAVSLSEIDGNLPIYFMMEFHFPFILTKC